MKRPKHPLVKVGKRVRVFDDDDGIEGEGKITSHDESCAIFSVKYDNGEETEVDMLMDRFEIL